MKNTRKLCFRCCHPYSERDLICQKCGTHDISGKSVYHCNRTYSDWDGNFTYIFQIRKRRFSIFLKVSYILILVKTCLSTQDCKINFQNEYHLNL